MSNIKECMKSILYLLDYIFLAFLGKRILKKKRVHAVHFSIDDVFGIVQKPNGKVMERLSILHEKYKLIVHNYVLYQKNEEILVQLPDRLRALTWMDWAPHQAEFISETNLLLGDAPRSHYVRLHEYRAEEKQINSLGGVSALLTADSDTRRSYGLSTESVSELARKGKITKNDVTYIKTDIRMEKLILLQLLRKRNFDGLLVMFTHECSYGAVEKRLYLLCALMEELSICFV